VNVELVLVRDDGTEVPTSVSAVELRDAENDEMGTLLIIADMTEQKRLEERFLRSQRMEAVGKLAGGIAHDFNNLLTVVLGYSNMLLLRPDLDPDMQRDLNAVRNAGEQAARLTSQLLTLSSRQVVDPVVTDPNAVIESINEVLRRVIGEHIALKLQLSRTLRPVLIDPGYLEQVVLNLVLNARDAMPGGGELAISTVEVDIKRREAAVDSEVLPGRYIALTVTDTGIGMDAATLEHCFDPFFSTKVDSAESGLGLPGVYGIVRQAGGHVQVETRVGAGTTFRLLFPTLLAQVAPKPVVALHAVSSGSERVMLVEDDDEVRAFSEIALRAQGYTVVTAGNGVAALDIAKSIEPVGLLITDVVMPEMGGLTLAATLSGRWPALKVLFVSGHAAGAQADLAGAAHAGHFLAKPYGPQDLLAHVRAVLDEDDEDAGDQGSKR
jgi:signal transduction histidine kinase/ActR/RegA family two-component response regulator